MSDAGQSMAAPRAQPGERWVWFLAVLFFAEILRPTLGFSAMARITPLFVGVTGFLLALAGFGLTFRRPGHPDGDAPTPGARAALSEDGEQPDEPAAGDWVPVAWVLFVSVAVLTLGFLVGGLVFMVTFLGVTRRASWLATALTVAGVLGVFGWVLPTFFGLSLIPGMGPLG
jgi:hypothetical protein